jgi:curli biogenesis system outer membrane secretion channel CsgG
MKRLIVPAIATALIAVSSSAYAEGHGQDSGAAAAGGGETTRGFSLDNLFKSGTETKVTGGQDTADINEVRSEAYNGPKARIAVARFKDKTGRGWWTGAIGDGMADQLTTALFNSNRYIVLERQTINDVLREQDLGGSGRVRAETAAPIGEIEGAELLVTGAVTEFEGNAGGGGGGLSGLLGGTIGSVVGAVAGGYRRAHMAIDLRVIDTKTSRVVAATSVEGEATDVNMGGLLGGATGGGALAGSLSGWKNTPVEKALRICIKKAVAFMASKTPPVYYRFGPGGAAPAVAVKAPATPSSARATTPSFPLGTVVRVKSAKLNMRAGPSQGNPVSASLTQGTPLLVEGQSGNWIQVRTQGNVAGWVAGWLTVKDPALSAANFATGAAGSGKITAPAAGSSGAAATGGAAGGATGGAGDVKARLNKLKQLYEADLITKQEYEAKRQEILADL